MAKIKATLTGGSTVNHMPAYDRIRHREQCLATTRDDTTIHAQVNSIPLSSVVESASVRTVDEWDWKTGKMVKRSLDIVENAKRNINTLKVHPVTNARHYENDKNEKGVPMCCGFGYGNQTPAPRGRRR